jgi:DNA-binding transcriptional LysR family regulator
VRLTPAGEEFLKRAERIREDILDARRITMAVQSNYQQAVRVYTTVPVALGILPAWLAAHDTHNHTIITSSVAGCTEALRQKRADQILLPWFKGDVADTQFTYTKIADDCLMPFESAHTKTPISLKNKCIFGPLLMYTPGTVLGQQVTRCWEKHGIEPDAPSVCEGAAAETLLALVDAGLGAAWLPQSIVKNASTTRCDIPEKLNVPFDVMVVERRD